MTSLMLAYALLLVPACSPSTSPLATAVKGEQETFDALAPSISDFAWTGSLICGRASNITISCTAVDTFGLLDSVYVDLSMLGGPKAQLLTGVGNLWSWSGTLMPAVAGERAITVTGFDETATAVASYSANVAVAANRPPTISGVTAGGILTQGEACALAVSCRVSDAEGAVQSVTVDLSPLGGPGAQALTHSGSEWTWSGTLTPPQSIIATLTCSATDDAGAVAMASTSIDVAPAAEVVVGSPASVAVTDMTVTGRILSGRASDITITCNASATDGNVRSVVADLSPLGGPAAQALSKKGSQWIWTGKVTSPAHGIVAIALKAAGSGNATATTSQTVGVVDSRALYADWLFVMAAEGKGMATADVPTTIAAIQKTNMPVVLLVNSIWEWDRTGTVLEREQVVQLVDGLRSRGITVGFHCLPPADSEELDRAWLYNEAVPKLTALGAKLVYADGTFGKDDSWYPASPQSAEYKEALRKVIGPDGIMLGGALVDGCEGDGSMDQGWPLHTWYFAQPRQYVEWRIAELGRYKERHAAVPWIRFDLGWIGEWIAWQGLNPIVPWPREDYAYVWKRARQENLPLTFRTTLEALVRSDDSYARMIGELEASATAGDDSRWSCAAMSADGTKIVAAAFGGRLYTSADSGATWTLRQPAGLAEGRWSRVAVSADGARIVATTFGGYLYLSTDGGTNWVERRPIDSLPRNWTGVAISSDGTKLTAVYDARIWTSSNFGTTWTLREPVAGMPKFWYCVNMSSTGEKITVSGEEGLFTSTNSGATWVKRTPSLGSNTGLNDIATSADGTKIIALSWPGRVYSSTNTGATWTETRPAGNTDQFWKCVAMSADGSGIVAAVWPGRLYVSTNGGTHWTERRPAGNADRYWESASMSADGTRIVATDGYGVYTSADSGANWTSRSVGTP